MSDDCRSHLVTEDCFALKCSAAMFCTRMPDSQAGCDKSFKFFSPSTLIKYFLFYCKRICAKKLVVLFVLYRKHLFNCFCLF